MLVGPTSTARLTTQHSSSSALSASSSFADSSSRAVSSGASIWIRTACYCVASLTFHFTGTPSGCSTTIPPTCMASLPCRQLPSTPPSSARSFARSLRSSITRRVAHARTQRIACLLPVVHARSQRIASCSACVLPAHCMLAHHHATSTLAITPRARVSSPLFGCKATLTRRGLFTLSLACTLPPHCLSCWLIHRSGLCGRCAHAASTRT